MKLPPVFPALLAALALAGCDTFGEGKKAEPPAEITIRSSDVLTMQRTLGASFERQGWSVTAQTERALRLSQPMTPDDAVRYFGRYQLGSPDADINYVFTFERKGDERTLVTARVTGTSAAAYGRVANAELTDSRSRKQLESVLKLLKKEMEKR